MLSLDPARPFVLLDDARVGGVAELFRDPVAVLSAPDRAAVRPLLDQLDARAMAGRVAAGLLAYEAGEALAGDDVGSPAASGPLAWFGLFDRVEVVPDVAALLPDPAAGAVVESAALWSFADYRAAFDRVAEAIAAGTVYQVNLAVPSRVAIAGDPLAVFAQLRRATRAPHCAVVWTGERLVLSFSPELFVERAGDRLATRPMKGTAARRSTPGADRAAAAALARDPKQRAENRMIVDLIRNDLARVAVPGSVAVPREFEVECYPNVWQMTSTVTATARPGVGTGALLAALFPCGSITGAPKRAAREVVAQVEGAPRGVYCGAIGRVGPDGDARLSVAIRTMVAVVAAPGEVGDAELSLGSGVVADSTAAAEWAECRLKGAFTAAARPRFDLIETMAVHPEHGIERLEGHLARLTRSAAALRFTFDRHAARNELQVATFGLAEACRLRLLLAPSGAMAVELSPLPQPHSGDLTFELAPASLGARDLRRWHKTTDRAAYDDPRRASAADEVVFLDAEGRVTEGSFTSVFVERGGVLVTPPAALGLIPGVLRDSLVADGRAVEGELWPGDLVGPVWLGNSVRGLMKARQQAGP